MQEVTTKGIDRLSQLKTVRDGGGGIPNILPPPTLKRGWREEVENKRMHPPPLPPHLYLPLCGGGGGRGGGGGESRNKKLRSKGVISLFWKTGREGPSWQ